MKTINLSAFNEASSLTIIATYAYLRYKQSQGEQLTFDENCLLNGRLGDSSLYPIISYVPNGGCIYPYYNLEGCIRLMAANIIARCKDETNFDLELLYCEMLAKLPFSASAPHIELLPDGTLQILSKNDMGCGTVVKCYEYHTASFDEMIDILLDYDEDLEPILEFLNGYPNEEMWMSFLKYDLLNAYCYSIFGNDFELVYQKDAQRLPQILMYRLDADIKKNLLMIKQNFYD